MRWHDFDMRFARPIHWIVALFSGETIPFTIGSTVSGDTTYGHRFMAPDAIRISSVSSYLDAIKKAHVVIEPAMRKQAITASIRELSQTVNGVPDEDENLLNEVTHLLESPFPVLCSFDTEYLNLPKEVILTPMKKHQKYFPILDRDGTPLPHFIAINNTDTTHPAVVISGHERVLRARLSDAQFFYAEDRKKTLAAMAEELKQVVFQAKLGTSYEKVMRFQKLAAFIAESLNMPALKPKVERAAYLCKADLVSEMVGEFPELQGIMGRQYAKIAGEPDDVSEAIFEHYLPRFAGDDLPAADAGAVVSLADKLDTIAGCFAVGLIPSGTADPYALRRQCLGIINILLDKKYDVSLPELVEKSIALLGDRKTRTADDIYKDVISFFSGRLSSLFTSQGFAYDVVNAILSLGVDNPEDTRNRIEALHRMKQEPDFESLAVSFKRVVNILAKQAAGSVDPSLLQDPEEKALYRKYLEVRDRVKELMSQKSYIDALKIISTIREAVDNFFDNVLVMAKDEKVKQNRLALLYEINLLFTNFADFSRIAAE
jgi:glycyl-tRNA synthetase beta chain